jgi:WG repeat protein
VEAEVAEMNAKHAMIIARVSGISCFNLDIGILQRNQIIGWLKEMETLRQTLRFVLLTILAGVLFGHFAPALGQQTRTLYKVTNKDNKIGFIDKLGKIVIDFDRLPPEAVVGSFSEGLAPICFLGRLKNQCGFIDETGKIVIPARFTLISEFSEGVAWARTEEFIGFIDRLGRVVFNLPESFSIGFRGGLAAIRTREGSGFVDKRGKFISTKFYEHVEMFSEGLAAVAARIETKAKYGFINESGAVVIPLQFDPLLGPHSQPMNLGRFTEGLAAVRIGNIYGYIDHKGKVVIAPRFREAAEFSEGLASVTTIDGQKGYIDKTGLLVIKSTSGSGGQFKGGLAIFSVEINGRTKMGYLDRTGKTIIEPRFDTAFDFIDGIAEVYVNEKLTSATGPNTQVVHGYIDKEGRFVWRSP